MRIGRLQIDAGAMTPAEGVRLAELVASALEQSTLAETAPRARPGPTLRVVVRPAPGLSLPQLAEGIAAAITRGLARGGAD
jgi:hypothetical protein